MSAKPWDMWPDENERQYKAFECYMEIDPRVRTLPNAWTKYKEIFEEASGDISSSFRDWSRKYKWSDRAKAYDQHLATKRRGAYEAGIVKEAKRRGVDVERLRETLGDNFQVIQNTLDELMTRVQNGQIDPEKITLAGIAGLLRIQLDIAKHLSDDTAGRTPMEELDKMSEEELVKKLREGTAGEGKEEGTP